jgi:hypothetical protein
MLAFAAQGVPGDRGAKGGGQIREFMRRAIAALTGIAETCAAEAERDGVAGGESLTRFLGVLDRDAGDSRAALELVLAQPSLSSQLIDNLNASIHLRALLTDLFVIDELFKLQRNTKAAPAPALSTEEQ